MTEAQSGRSILPGRSHMKTGRRMGRAHESGPSGRSRGRNPSAADAGGDGFRYRVRPDGPDPLVCTHPTGLDFLRPREVSAPPQPLELFDCLVPANAQRFQASCAVRTRLGNAEIHNPWHCWLQKAFAPLPKRDDTACDERNCARAGVPAFAGTRRLVEIPT